MDDYATFGINDWRAMIMQADLNCQTKCVAYTLSMHYRINNPCYPSQMTLADEASLDPKTVRKALDILEKEGFIVRHKKKMRSFSYNVVEYRFRGVVDNDRSGTGGDGIGNTSGSDREDIGKSHLLNKGNKVNTEIREEINNADTEIKKFVIPTVEEVAAYIAERKLSVDAEAFIRYYNATDWVDSNGNKVECWQNKVAIWESATKTPKPNR